MRPLVVTMITCFASGLAASLPTSESQAITKSQLFRGPEEVELQNIAEEAVSDTRPDEGKSSSLDRLFWNENQLSKKMKREIENNNGPESEETPELPETESSLTPSPSSEEQGEVLNELPPHILQLREQIAGTLLVQSDRLEMEQVRPIADEAVRRLMEEIDALGEKPNPPKAVVRLTQDLLEGRVENRQISAVKDRAYKLAWAYVNEPFDVSDDLALEFGNLMSEEDYYYYSAEAFEMVLKELSAIKHDSPEDDELHWVLKAFPPETNYQIGRLLQHAVQEARTRNLNADELQSLLYALYPSMKSSIRKEIARGAITLAADEEYVTRIKQIMDWTAVRGEKK